MPCKYREDDFDLYNFPFRIDLEEGLNILYKPDENNIECLVIKSAYTPKNYITTTMVSRENKIFPLTFLVHKNVWTGSFLPSYRRNNIGDSITYYVL